MIDRLIFSYDFAVIATMIFKKNDIHNTVNILCLVLLAALSDQTTCCSVSILLVQSKILHSLVQCNSLTELYTDFICFSVTSETGHNPKMHSTATPGGSCVSERFPWTVQEPKTGPETNH